MKVRLNVERNPGSSRLQRKDDVWGDLRPRLLMHVSGFGDQHRERRHEYGVHCTPCIQMYIHGTPKQAAHPALNFCT